VLTAERRQYILQLLERDGKVIAKQLSDELKLSEDTIRRDLRDLAAEGFLTRVHGGALPSSPASANFYARQSQAPQAKSAIARAASRLFRDGQVIFMDGGTTNIQVAEQLAPDLHATIVTNSPPLATALVSHPYVDVIMLGGRLFKHSVTTTGAGTREAIDMVHADLYLLGVCSLHPDVGISTVDMEEAYLKRAMIASSAEVVALASLEKLNTAAPYIVGPLTDLSEIITEQNVSDEIIAPYQALGITVTRA